MPDKIRITYDELRDPRVDEVIERERAIREVAARSERVGGLRRLIFSSITYTAIVGALGGLVGWALVEGMIDDGTVVIGGKVQKIDPNRTLAFCNRCREIVPPAAAAGGKCPDCQSDLGAGPIRGSFHLGAISVLVAPGSTKVARAGKAEPLRAIDDLEADEPVKVHGLAIEGGDELVATRIERNPAGGVPATLDALPRRRERNLMENTLIFAIVGGTIALFVGSIEGLLSFNVRQVLRAGGFGFGIGFAGGMAGTIPASMLYGASHLLTARLAGDRPFLSIDDMHGWPLFAQIAGRACAWGVVGMALALGQGVALKSRRLIFNGLIGGLLGGLFGGLLFDPISKLDLADSGDLNRAVGFTSIGLFVGLCIGLVEHLAKEAWLLLRSGPLMGKQFVVHRSPTTIGSSGACDIFLFKDRAVRPEHARLTRVGRAYEVEDLGDGGTLVNGEAIRRRILRDGDLITIGSTELEYRSRGT